jgi:glycosyltransferase involved in cell wall biosynthesis
MSEPLVSALITVYNGERYLGEAIESALAQTYDRIELIVVDNGSTDRSPEIARSFGPRVRVHVEPERGINRVRNAAVAEAAGEHLAFLDGDDVWDPLKTERQIAAFAADPSAAVVIGHVEQFLSPDCDPSLARRFRIPERPQPGLVLGAVLAPRRVFDLVGPLSTEYSISDGLEWFLQVRRHGLREVLLPEVVTRRRVHGANHSYRCRAERGEFARLLKASIDERRRGGGSSGSGRP